MTPFSYEHWLASHATKKSVMEKLERSLIPYVLFEKIPLRNDRKPKFGDIVYSENTYQYEVKYDYNCFGSEVYDVVINPIEIVDAWNDPLMGYNRFKVVFRGSEIITIYSDHENFFEQVIDMFENENVNGLFQVRSAYVNNLLARYIIVRLIDRYIPDMQILANVNGITVLGANANRTSMIKYAFSRREAEKIARHYDGMARSLRVIYFFNQDFERDGNMPVNISKSTEVLSIRAFCQRFTLSPEEKLALDFRILWIVAMLYNEHIHWDAAKIRHKATNPPLRTGKESCPKMPRTLLEDALGVLDTKPQSRVEIFHFLCAATLVNGYVNQCNKRCGNPSLMRNMFKSKHQIFETLAALLRERNRELSISMSTEGKMPSIFADMEVRGIKYQFTYRGLSASDLAQFLNLKINTRGHYKGYAMQSIAPILYQYS